MLTPAHTLHPLLPLLALITAQEGADAKMWIELVVLIALAGAFVNEVRAMSKIVREHSARLKGLEKNIAILSRIEVRMKYMNYEIRRLSTVLSGGTPDPPPIPRRSAGGHTADWAPEMGGGD